MLKKGNILQANALNVLSLAYKEPTNQILGAWERKIAIGCMMLLVSPSPHTKIDSPIKLQTLVDFKARAVL